MAKTYEPIATITTTGSASTATFSSIPGTYTDLVIVANPTLSGTGSGINLTFNSDTSSSYSSTRLYGDGSTATSDRQASGNFLNFALGNVNNGQLMLANIQNYANTTTFKTIVMRQNTASTYVGALVGLYRATPAAITTITLTAGGSLTYVNGSTFTLYGIKAA